MQPRFKKKKHSTLNADARGSIASAINASHASVTVEGPDSCLERVRISPADSPQAIEHCLRAIFGLAQDVSIVLRDSEGRAVPLGGGLCATSQQGGESVATAVYKIQVVNHKSLQTEEGGGGGAGDFEEFSTNRHKSEIAQDKLEDVLEDTIDAEKYAIDQCRFWCYLAGSFWNSSATFRKAAGKTTMFFDTVDVNHPSHEQLWDITTFDTSPSRINKIFNAWANKDGTLALDVVLRGLGREHSIVLSESQLKEALESLERKCTHRDSNSLSRFLFMSLWQRLMLGVVCHPLDSSQMSALKAPGEVRLVGYNEHVFEERIMSEQEFLFGSGNLRFKSRERVSSWVRIDSAEPERIARMGVKFFLHPILTTGAIEAIKESATKIDVHRHQYLITLEVYGLTESCRAARSASYLSQVPMRVCDCVARSIMCLVASGNPERGYRDCIMSLVNIDSDQSQRTDPLDRFQYDVEAAVEMLNCVKKDLRTHERMRESWADFLLYSILDQAVREALPICSAYGYRLRWLQDQLDAEKLRICAAHVDEVSNACMELQELRQWVGQMKSIVKHLEVDCKSPDNGAVAWNFGAAEERSGKSLTIFLHSTQETLEAVSQKLVMLEELAQNFSHNHERLSAQTMNRTLLLLTTASAVFLPAQFFCGVYGMNFKHSDGEPGLPELSWDYGYLYFWCLICGLTAIGVFIVRYLHT